jgi:hypothetical protein
VRTGSRCSKRSASSRRRADPPLRGATRLLLQRGVLGRAVRQQAVPACCAPCERSSFSPRSRVKPHDRHGGRPADRILPAVGGVLRFEFRRICSDRALAAQCARRPRTAGRGRARARCACADMYRRSGGGDALDTLPGKPCQRRLPRLPRRARRLRRLADDRRPVQRLHGRREPAGPERGRTRRDAAPDPGAVPGGALAADRAGTSAGCERPRDTGQVGPRSVGSADRSPCRAG